jgi:hypothetical protein
VSINGNDSREEQFFQAPSRNTRLLVFICGKVSRPEQSSHVSTRPITELVSINGNDSREEQLYQVDLK